MLPRLTLAVAPLLVAFGLCSPCSIEAAAPRPVFDSRVINPATPGHTVEVAADITGAKELYLVVLDGGDGFSCDWAAWANARLSGPAGELSLSDLKWKQASSGFLDVQKNKNVDGGPIRIQGRTYDKGLGVHATSVVAYDLPAGYTKFLATAGLDDQGTSQGCGSTVQFVVYTQKPPAILNSAAPGGGSRELVDAAAQLDVAEGLEVALFAGEPELKSPSNIDVDHLGRVWVCEVVNYRRFANQQNPDRPEGDRILILEDTNHDGVSDKTTVFYQGTDVDSAHGICVLGDRVILSVGDSVFSLYDRDGDLKADAGSKELMLTGISGTQHDHGIHAFVFGPDGKLYFNFGNAGQQIKDANGQPIVDQSGNEINDRRQPYQEGMVFRCNLDGSAMETLGWNFRNNWEVCVDSFGSMWQSDNDDDGNRGVRINFVMEYGNYGYKDELTGAGWQSPRTNLETEIPLRHWHLNDPGVMPNLLQTGAGSPTGICVYEGSLLPEVFHNQVLHCDAGPNVVRAYVATPSGAGYTAEMVNLLQGARDNWFRPSDVCVAPDGSLIVADWYDPGVGGHRQGDVERGRIFRVAPPGTKYVAPEVDLRTADGATNALRSPNQATRYLAYAALKKMGTAANSALQGVFARDANPRQRARALGLLAGNAEVLRLALTDVDADIRLMALRLIRERFKPAEGTKNTDTLLQAIALLRNDTSAAVRRECAVALHDVSASDHSRLGVGVHIDEGKPELWAELAAQYQAGDRWALEALGIGARDDWDACLEAYFARVPDALQTPAGRDIVWRSRGSQTPELLAQLVTSPKTPIEELPRYFRALDFLKGESRDAAIVQLAFNSEGLPEAVQQLISAEAVGRLQGFDLSTNPQQKDALERTLERCRGTSQFIKLVDRFNLNDRLNEVLALATEQPDSPVAVEAVSLLLSRGQQGLLGGALASDQPEMVSAMIRALGNSLDNRVVELLEPVMLAEDRPLDVRQAAVRGLARPQAGAQRLLALAAEQKLAEDLLQVAAFSVHASPYNDVKQAAEKVFPLPPSRNAEPLPPLAQLLKATGDVTQGEKVFAGVGKCNTCHIVRGAGKEVGPNLTEIGSKLSREAMFESILYPSAGISHNYETWVVETRSGTTLSGILVSQTDQELILRGADAIARTIPRSEVEELVKQPVSLMPADLQKAMTVEELLDVIAYTQSLKKVE